MTETGSTVRRQPTLWWSLAIVVAFLVGAGWQYFRAHEAEQRATTLQERLYAVEAEVAIGSATLEAQQGHFERARQRASDFFTIAQRDLMPLLPGDRAASLGTLLTERDATITSLSRSEPGVGTALYELWARFREIVQATPTAADSIK